MEGLKSFRRTIKEKTLGLDPIEVKVREATNNDNWGCSTTIMSEIAAATSNYEEYGKLFAMLWKRLTDYEQVQHVKKALILVEYLLRNGADRFIADCKAHQHDIRKLVKYKYYDKKDHKDIAGDARQKAKRIVELLGNDDELREQRKTAKQIMDVKNQSFSNEYSSTKRHSAAGQSKTTSNFGGAFDRGDAGSAKKKPPINSKSPQKAAAKSKPKPAAQDSSSSDSDSSSSSSSESESEEEKSPKKKGKGKSKGSSKGDKDKKKNNKNSKNNDPFDLGEFGFDASDSDEKSATKGKAKSGGKKNKKDDVFDPFGDGGNDFDAFTASNSNNNNNNSNQAFSVPPYVAEKKSQDVGALDFLAQALTTPTIQQAPAFSTNNNSNSSAFGFDDNPFADVAPQKSTFVQQPQRQQIQQPAMQQQQQPVQPSLNDIWGQLAQADDIFAVPNSQNQPKQNVNPFAQGNSMQDMRHNQPMSNLSMAGLNINMGGQQQHTQQQYQPQQVHQQQAFGVFGGGDQLFQQTMMQQPMQQQYQQPMMNMQQQPPAFGGFGQQTQQKSQTNSAFDELGW